jgi:hypothetical protein
MNAEEASLGKREERKEEETKHRKPVVETGLPGMSKHRASAGFSVGIAR